MGNQLHIQPTHAHGFATSRCVTNTVGRIQRCRRPKALPFIRAVIWSIRSCSQPQGVLQFSPQTVCRFGGGAPESHNQFSTVTWWAPSSFLVANAAVVWRPLYFVVPLICWFIHLSIHSSVDSFHLSIHPSVDKLICWFFHLSIHSSVVSLLRLFIYLPIHSSVDSLNLTQCAVVDV